MTHTPAAPGRDTAPATTTAQPRGGRAQGGLALIVRTIAGAALLLLGTAMLVLPGPGLVVIVAGLSLLAVDYVWARRLRTRATERFAATGRTIRRKMTTHRRSRHDRGEQADRSAFTGRQDVPERDSRRGVEHPATEGPS